MLQRESGGGTDATNDASGNYADADADAEADANAHVDADANANVDADADSDLGADVQSTSCVAAPNGTSCDAGAVCSNGACQPCLTGVACGPSGNVCRTGMVDCSTGVAVCMTTGVAPAGTVCGVGQVCDGFGDCSGGCSGACVPPGDGCQRGVISCATGSPVCNVTGNAADSTPCGASSICCGGTCRTSNDNDNCGGCGHACDVDAGSHCVNGLCS
jgi:hypothetical protein